MEPISSATGKTVTEMERGRLDHALEPSIRTDDNVDESPRPTKSQIHPAKGAEP